MNEELRIEERHSELDSESPVKIKTVKLSDICTLEKGTQINTSLLRNSNPYKYINGGIKESGFYDKYNSSGEAVLISEGGASCGYINYINEDFWCGCHCYKLNNIKVFPKYLFHALKANQTKIMNLRKGSTMPNIQKKEIQNFELKIQEDLQTQKQIASRLDLCADTIAKHKKLLELHETLIKSQFVKMFGDPVTNPMGWEVKPIQEVAPIQQAEKNCSEKVWLLNLDMIESQTGEIIDYLIIDKNKVGNSTYYFDEKNVLYSKLRPYLNKVVIPEKKGICTSELVPLKPTSILNRYFLANLLRSKSFVSYINEKTEGSKMPRVSMKIFRDFSCILPPLPLQQKFATFVQQVEKSKQSVQTSLQKAETLYKALMQKYFI